MTSILLVEDDFALSMGVEFALKGSGFQVYCAKTIKDAKDSLTKNPDLILLDVMLPDGSGYDFCKFVRSKSDVPIIFLTACNEEVNVIMGLDLGGDDYLPKPIRIGELISRINAVLRRKGHTTPSKSQKIISEKFTVDILQCKVTKDNVELNLTISEYKLLITFLENPNLVLTRNQLLDALWSDNGDFVDDNTLSVYIRRLREKLEDDPTKPSYILTVRGFGYKWGAAVKH